MLHEEWIQGSLLGSPPRQFLASLVLVTAMLGLFRVAGLLREVMADRYSRNVAEATEMLVMAAGIGATAFLLAEVWGIAFVVERVVDNVTLDRWEGVRFAVSVALLAIGYMVLRAANRSYDRLHEQGSITTHQKEVAYHVSGIAIFAVVGLTVLSVWGIALTNLIVSAGVVTAVLGLAARRTVAAIVAGFFLLFSRPFRVGDWIEVADAADGTASGIVEDVTISHTKIRTFNDEHVLVPNDQVTANRLTNYTRSDRLRIDVEVDVDYDADIDRACGVICHVAKDIECVSEVREPKVVVKRLGDSSVVLELHFWIDNPARRRVWRARTDVIAGVKAALDREGITIPFPQRSHVPRDEGGFRVDAPVDPPVDSDAAADREFEVETEAED